MTDLFLIRHGITAWNEARRIQGRTDVPLSDAGVEQVRRWRLPPHLRTIDWYVSPLSRTAETARLLGLPVHASVEALVEMEWGEWTGRRIADLRTELGEELRVNEARGLDFMPPGGESPRMVRTRLAAWLAELGDCNGPVGAVTHKGVIRAALSLATGWDLTADFGQKLARDALHVFRIDDGALAIRRLNVPL